MKNHYSVIILGLLPLTALSRPITAMEEPLKSTISAPIIASVSETSPNVPPELPPLERLQKIVKDSFVPVVYDDKADTGSIEYLLQETMPESVPPLTLCTRVLTTNDGMSIFDLANLYSVSSRHLANLFGRDVLNALVTKRLEDGKFPETLNGLPDEVLKSLYPVFKVALAADPGHKEVLRLVGERHSTYRDSLTKLRLLSLDTENPDYDNILKELMLMLTPVPILPFPDQHSLGVIARELLMAGKHVAFVNSLYYKSNPSKKEVATQLITWCLQTGHWTVNDALLLIYDSLGLNRRDLALKVLDHLVSLPDTPETVPTKVSAFTLEFIDDPRFSEKLKSLFENFYTKYWELTSPTDKCISLRCVIRGGNRDEVQKAVDSLFGLPVETILRSEHNRIITDLNQHGYHEASAKIIRYLLTVAPNNLSSFYWNQRFIDLAILVDRVGTIGLLKAVVESPETNSNVKLEALVCLAQHEKVKEKEYVLRKFSTLNTKVLEGDTALEVSSLYYYLGIEKLFQTSYRKMLGVILSHTDAYSVVLTHLNERGLGINSIEELKRTDPAKVMEAILNNNIVSSVSE